MEEAPENGKELLHSARANGMNVLDGNKYSNIEILRYKRMNLI